MFAVGVKLISENSGDSITNFGMTPDTIIEHFDVFKDDLLRAHYADHLRHAVDVTEMENILPGNVTESALSYESISGRCINCHRSATIFADDAPVWLYDQEAASIIGMKESAVKVAAHRAYKVLGKMLVEK